MCVFVCREGLLSDRVTEWVFISVCLCTSCFMCRYLFQVLYVWKVWQPLQSIHFFLLSVFTLLLLPSFLPPFLPSVLPHHSPVTWYSYNLLRHVLMLFFFFFCFLLSVGTHPHTLFHSISLNPSLRLFRLSLEREKASKRERESATVWSGIFVAAIMWICCLFVFVCSLCSQ